MPPKDAATTAPPAEGVAAVLEAGLRLGATDWQFRAGEPAYLRVAGEIRPASAPPLPETELRGFATRMLGRAIPHPAELDATFDHGGERFRLHAYTAEGAFCFTLRHLPGRLPELAALGVPPAFASKALGGPPGLILVTGPTGSGKSTTLAAAIDYLNRERAEMILTLEDPIEYRHPHRRSVVRQMEKGRDFADFGAALRGALRIDPDAILVGEMRDQETIAAALMAAETGHRVLATLHAPSAAAAIARVVGAFPAEHAGEVRVQLASTLVAVLAQQLIHPAGRRRCAAFELLLSTPGVRHLVADPAGKHRLLANEIATGHALGMITMDQSLEDLWRRGRLSRDDALQAASQPATLEPLLRRSA
jgi:twitching motility protein PilT